MKNTKHRTAMALMAFILAFGILLTGYVGNTATGEARVKLDLAVKYMHESQYQKAILAYEEGITIAYRQAFERMIGKNKIVPTNGNDSEQGITLSYDYFIPDVTKKYVISIKSSGSLEQDNYVAKGVITWDKLASNRYAKNKSTTFNDENNISKNRTDLRTDLYEIQGNDVAWLSASENHGWREDVTEGTSLEIKSVKPGETWLEQYTTVSQVNNRSDSQQISSTNLFEKLEMIQVMGNSREAAHLSSMMTGGNNDYWYVKGLGLVKFTMNYTGQNFSRQRVEELVSVEERYL